MDLIVDNTDWPGKDMIAKRLRAMVPPALLEATEEVDEKEAPALVAQLKTQLAGLNQQLQQIQLERMPEKEAMAKVSAELLFTKHDQTLKTNELKIKYKEHEQKLRFEQEKVILEAEIKKRELVDQRTVKYPEIHCCVINDQEILEETSWPGKHIPIVPFKGVEFWIDGERILKGLVADMKDPQKQLNYFTSWQAEMVMIAPKAPYVGTETMFEANPQEWANLHVSNQAFVTFQHDPLRPQERPMRDTVEPPIQGAAMLVPDIDPIRPPGKVLSMASPGLPT